MNIKGDDTVSQAPDYDTSPVIYLSDDQVEALGITDIPKPGKSYTLRVVAVAVSVTASQEEPGEVEDEGETEGPEVRLTLKLTDIEIVDSGKSIASSLYGE